MTTRTMARASEIDEQTGPNWKWLLGISGSIIGVLISLLFFAGTAAFNYQMRVDEAQGGELQKHTSEIVRLQADTEYIKAGVDEIRGILRGRQ